MYYDAVYMQSKMSYILYSDLIVQELQRSSNDGSI